MGMRCKSRNGKSPSNAAEKRGKTEGRWAKRSAFEGGKGRKGHTRKKDNKIKK
jgi:hypothetical protein